MTNGIQSRLRRYLKPNSDASQHHLKGRMDAEIHPVTNNINVLQGVEYRSKNIELRIKNLNKNLPTDGRPFAGNIPNAKTFDEWSYLSSDEVVHFSRSEIKDMATDYSSIKDVRAMIRQGDRMFMARNVPAHERKAAVIAYLNKKNLECANAQKANTAKIEVDRAIAEQREQRLREQAEMREERLRAANEPKVQRVMKP